MLQLLLIALIFVVVAAVVVLLISLPTVGIGWLLSWFYSFSLFEGTVVAVLCFFVFTRILSEFTTSAPNPFFDEDDDEDDNFQYEIERAQEEEYKSIAAKRFAKKDSDKTVEAWFTFEFANDIYVEFQDSPKAVSNMSDLQVQELSIRLAEIAVNYLKSKTSRAKNLTMTKNVFQNQTKKMGQRTYDDDLIDPALEAINGNIYYYESELKSVIREKGWETETDWFEREE
ncbi:MAG: hypothetical protein AAF639_46240 [Chloroflexota bacterium]